MDSQLPWWMPKWLNDWIYYRLIGLCLWSGSKVYPVVATYVPEGDNLGGDAPVEVIHLARSEAMLDQAISYYYHRRIANGVTDGTSKTS